MRAGAVGCISATANINPGPIARLHATWQAADADRQQQRLDEIRTIMQSYVMIPALKAAIAHWGGDPAWTTVRLTEHAVKGGCAGVLMLPPFYYKDVSEDGLFRSFAEVIERVGDARLRIYLYHIPPVAVVGITTGLVERLLKKYPTAIAGMKDSSGDWSNTKKFLDAFAKSGFDVFVGSESFLLANMRENGAGCISATANVNPGPIDKLYREWRNADAPEQQETLNAIRKATGQYVMIPALKAVVAHYSKDPAWMTVRPPLVALSKEQAQKVIDDLEGLGFEMPGLRREAITA